MGRPATGSWDERSRRYYARLGETDPATGRRRKVELRHEDGRPIAYGDRAAVAAAVQRLLAERDARARREAGPTVAEVCAAFVAWHAANGAAPRTVADHRNNLRRFGSLSRDGVLLWDRPAASITPEDLWAADAAGLGGLRHLYMSVLACWRWAARPVKGRTPARLLEANPLAGLERPRRGRRSAKPIPWVQARALLRFARARARVPSRSRRERTRAAERLRVLCLHFIAATGARPFEAYALEWSEVRWDEGIVAIRPDRDKGRRPGAEPAKPRRIAVPPRLLAALRLVQSWEGAHVRFVFVPAWARIKDAPRSREFGAWLRGLRAAALRARVPIPEALTAYWLRHEWQTVGLEVESAEGVSAAAGNSPHVLLSTYDHTYDRRVREVAEKVAQARRRRA